MSSKKADTVKSPKDWKGLNAGVTSIGSGTHTIMRALTAVRDATVRSLREGRTLQEIEQLAAQSTCPPSRVKLSRAKAEITAYRANVSVDLRLDQGVSGANTTGSRAYAPRRKVMGLAF